jgi:hypothetical protein
MEITVEMDGDSGMFELYVSGGGMSSTMPAGPRLFRADPPEIRFQHAEHEAAAVDAKKLQKYLDGLAPSKRLTKKQVAEAFA